MTFEWDTRKNKINKRKHKISFETAKYVFTDPTRIEIYDEIHSFTDEERVTVLGKVHEVLFVVYTMRKENIRIISARLATKEEKEAYYGNSLYFTK